MEEQTPNSSNTSPTSLDSALRLKRNSRNLAPITIKRTPGNAILSPGFLSSPLAKEFTPEYPSTNPDGDMNKKMDKLVIEDEDIHLKPDAERPSAVFAIHTPIEIIKETPYEENDSSETKAKPLSISSNEDLEKKPRKSSVEIDRKHDEITQLRDRANSLLRKISVNRNHTKMLSSESEPDGDVSTPAMRLKIGTFLKKHFPNKKHESEETQGLKSLKAILMGLENKINPDEPEEVSISSPLAGKEHRNDHLFEKLMHHKFSHPISPTQASQDSCEVSPKLNPRLSVETPEISPRLAPTDVHLGEKGDSCEIPSKSDEISPKSEEQPSEYGSREIQSNSEIASESRDSEWHFPKFLFYKNHEKKAESVEGIATHPRTASIAKKSSRSSSMSLKFYQHEPQMSKSGSEVSLSEKYGPRDSVLGKGASATVRIAHKREKDAKWFAIKEFRKKKKEETEKDSSLHHPNVVETIDLIKDEHGKWCEVMEYCPGGDLLVKMTTVGFAGPDEMFCLFKQLLFGVDYLHKTGVAHRDLKPENLLLDAGHRFLKITDFGKNF
ncbi:serine/threonine-protein kinase HAL4/sat4 [Terramyces sp. JEL0728]|nr:serine/threonine-protein kinase HAL4/sat4 [Terramyces sp. JEL0728]